MTVTSSAELKCFRQKYQQSLQIARKIHSFNLYVQRSISLLQIPTSISEFSLRVTVLQSLVYPYLTRPQSSLLINYLLGKRLGYARGEDGKARGGETLSPFPSSPSLKSSFQSSTPITNNERRMGTSQYPYPELDIEQDEIRKPWQVLLFANSQYFGVILKRCVDQTARLKQF